MPDILAGSLFTVDLRFLFLLAPIRPVPPTRDVTPAVSTEADSARRRVLLAEDNPVNQLVARGLLTCLGCDVDVAANGQEAVRLFAAGRYDLVLMDCMMPGLDGYEATAAIRRIEPAGRRTPVVAMTANAMQGAGSDASLRAWTTTSANRSIGKRSRGLGRRVRPAESAASLLLQFLAETNAPPSRLRD